MEQWDAIAPSVAMLKTGSSVMSARLPNLLSDYLRHVPNLLVVSNLSAPPPEPGRPAVLDVLHGPAAQAIAEVDVNAVAMATRALVEQAQASAPPLPSPPLPSPPPEAEVGWDADRRKNIPTYVATWARFPGRDWYIMVDDDTWVNLPNLAALLAPLNASEPLYLGNPYVLSGRGCAGLRLGAVLFAHGGSGIILSRAAVELLVPQAPTCMREFGECWAGDGMLGLCLHSIGILPRHGDGLCGDSPFDLFKPDARGCPPHDPPPEHCVAPRPVTYHRIRERWQVAMLAEHETLQRRSPVSLRDFLYRRMWWWRLRRSRRPLNTTRRCNLKLENERERVYSTNRPDRLLEYCSSRGLEVGCMARLTRRLPPSRTDGRPGTVYAIEY